MPRGTTSYAYDSANQLIRENNQAANKTWTWEYDNGGNILCKKEYAYTTGALGTLKDTIEYGYDYMEWGQLLSSYDGHEVDYGLDGFTTSLFYDDRYEYAWEHGHQLRYLYEFFTEYYFCEYYFAYDANGMRTKMVRNTTDLECDQYWKDTYEYTYNGTQLTRMTYEGEAGWYTLDIRYDADGTPVSVTFEHVAHEPDMENGGYLDESSAYDCCSGTYYYITNLQGDVIALVDELGNLAASYTYDAWGNIVARTSKECIAAGNPLRYRGYVYDGATGFYYLQSRYYDPVKGRFISPDAFVSTGQGILGNNMFAYCGNNPVARVDISGHSWVAVVIGVVAGAIVGVGTSWISSAVTGQEFTWRDAGFAALSGGISSIGGAGGLIAGSVISGGYSAYTAYEDGANLFGVIGSGISSGLSNMVSFGDLAKAGDDLINIATSAFVDFVFGTGFSSMDAAISKTLTENNPVSTLPLKNKSALDVVMTVRRISYLRIYEGKLITIGSKNCSFPGQFYNDPRRIYCFVEF